MKSYKDLTIRYLKENRKRTILTIIGVILSVALVSSIAFFLKSIRYSLVKGESESSGRFHVAYKNGDEELYNKLKNNIKVDTIGAYKEQGDVVLLKNRKLKLVISNSGGKELLPIKLKEGKSEDDINSIAIEEWILKYFENKPNIGDNIKLKLEDGSEKQFKLTGILENGKASQVNQQGIGLVIDNNLNLTNANIILTAKDKGGLKSNINELIAIDKDNAVTNEYLLKYLGASESNELNITLYAIVSTVIAIVVIATIAVIYNSFNISVVQRIKQFGLLRAVGATPKQIRKIVLREAAITALIGIPIGLFFGVVAIYSIKTLFGIMSDNLFLPYVTLPLSVFIISSLIGLISVYLSAILPAMQASSISPLLAISSRNSIVKEKIKRKRFKLLNKFFGINTVMAYRNLKRNKKRFRITIFSMTISIVLFVVFTGLFNMGGNIYDEINESANIDFYVSLDRTEKLENSSKILTKELLESIKKIDGVNKVYSRYNSENFIALLSKDKINEDFFNRAQNRLSTTRLGSEERIAISSNLDVYDNDMIEDSKLYLKEGALDKNKLNAENGVILVKDSSFMLENKRYVGILDNLEVGDEVYLSYSKEGKPKDAYNKNELKKVKVLGIMENSPFDGQIVGRIKLISTPEVCKNLTDSKGDIPVNSFNITTDREKEESIENELTKLEDENLGIEVTNIIEAMRMSNSSNSQLQILLIGFVVVVSLIGSVNIMNTVATNLVLRKKEFAAIKSIGMTNKGVRKMIVTEGLIYGLISAVYGGIIGTAICYLMFVQLSSIRDFVFAFPWVNVLIAMVASLILGYISSILPLRKLNKEVLVDALREE